MTNPVQCQPFYKYILRESADKFLVEPADANGVALNENYLEIDRVTEDIRQIDPTQTPIIQLDTTTRLIRGLAGVVRLVAGPYLLVVTEAESVGHLNGQVIYRVTKTDLLPFQRRTLHLTEKQNLHNRNFLDMVGLVLAQDSFYFSVSLDLTQSLQRLDNVSPIHRRLVLYERAEERFFWNKYLLSEFRGALPEVHRFVVTLILGFVEIKQSSVNGRHFSVTLISRRSCRRAGPRFWMRGADGEGHAANFVETEQIIEYRNQETGHVRLTSFVQTRGSIPLDWSQAPNLRWQPTPTICGAENQQHHVLLCRNHMASQVATYGVPQVLVNLVNQVGREKNLGLYLKQVVSELNMPGVRHESFDFHKECRNFNWERLSLLRDRLLPYVENIGFFATRIIIGSETGGDAANDGFRMTQSGCFRTNCMDCLDRTNVVQSIFAKESLVRQLNFLKILAEHVPLDAAFNDVFKNLWADNGDVLSKQYAGTAALKADYTRLGRRTMMGGLDDVRNAVTRYFRNNFMDGLRQDSLDLFLGKYKVDRDNLPDALETNFLMMDWFHSGFIIGLVVSFAMTVLCVTVPGISENFLVFLFWLSLTVLCAVIIFTYGDEFVNRPKLKTD